METLNQLIIKALRTGMVDLAVTANTLQVSKDELTLRKKQLQDELTSINLRLQTLTDDLARTKALADEAKVEVQNRVSKG